MTKFHHVQSQDLSVHQDDAVFRCHSPGMLLVPVQFFQEKKTKKACNKLCE